MNELPKISVVVPVFNSARTIEKALLSVLEQHYPNLEIIVIDGGSNDGTVDVIKRYEKQLAYWHSKRDGSCGMAINLGIQKSTGDIVAQLMADDWFEPGIFHVIAKAYLANPQAEIISCGGRFVKYDTTTAQYKTTTQYMNEDEMAVNVYNMCFAIPAMSSRFLTRAFIKRVGLMVPFDDNGKHHYSADRELLLRAAVMGCKNVHVNQLGHSYFIHELSATFGGNSSNRVRIYEEHMRWVDRYIKQYSLSPQNKSLLYVWYNDQSVKYFLQQLLNHQWKLALQIASRGIKKTKWRWVMALITTPCAVAAKRIVKSRQLFVKT